jgi:hypothetical protein
LLQTTDGRTGVSTYIERYMPAQLSLKVSCKNVKLPICEEIWLHMGTYEVHGIQMKSKDNGT